MFARQMKKEILIGNALRFFRMQANKTQFQLECDSYVADRTIRRLEANKARPHQKTVQKLCEALGVSRDEIIEKQKQLSENSNT